MLIRCVYCGKPVFVVKEGQPAECSYCFRGFFAKPGQSVQIRPETLEWEAPLFNAAFEFRQGSEDSRVLLLLGSYQGAAELVRKQGERKLREIREEFEKLEKAVFETEDPAYADKLIAQLQETAQSREAVQNWEQRMEALLERQSQVHRAFVIRRLQSLSAELDEADSLETISRIVREIHIWGEEQDISVLLEQAARRKKQLREAAQQRRHERNRMRIAELAEKIEQAEHLRQIDLAVSELEKLQEEPECGPVLERARALREERQRRQAAEERRRKRQLWLRRSAVFSALVILTAVLLVLYRSHQEQQMERLQTARAQMEAGEYEEAATAYSLVLEASLVNKEILQRAQEEQRENALRWADALVRAGEYGLAVEKYEQAGDTEKADEARERDAEELIESEQYAEAVKVLSRLGGQEDRLREIYILLGDQNLQAGMYESAVAAYEKGGADSKTLSDAYLAWGEALADEGQNLEAVRRLSQAEDSPQTDARIQELSLAAADEQFARVMQVIAESAQMSDEEITRILAQYGERLWQIDGQVRYCTHLLSSGYDLEQVYPEGVVVRWKVLQERLPYEQAEPDVSKVLVFSRTMPDRHFSDETTGKTDAQYRIRFHPGDWQKLSEECRAMSLEECTCILLAESAYEKDGVASGSTVYPDYSNPKSANTTSIWNTVSTYCAREQICLVDWPAGKKVQIMASRTDRPRASRYKVDYTSSAHNILYLTLNDLGLSGSFDEAWRREKMNLAVGWIADGQRE